MKVKFYNIIHCKTPVTVCYRGNKTSIKLCKWEMNVVLLSSEYNSNSLSMLQYDLLHLYPSFCMVKSHKCSYSGLVECYMNLLCTCHWHWQAIVNIIANYICF